MPSYLVITQRTNLGYRRDPHHTVAYRVNASGPDEARAAAEQHLDATAGTAGLTGWTRGTVLAVHAIDQIATL